MHTRKTSRARLAGGAVIAAAAVAVALVGTGSAATAAPGGKNTPNGPTIDIQLLSFNDFHGNLETPSRVQRSARARPHPAGRSDQAGGHHDRYPHAARSRRRRIPRDAPRQARAGHPYSLTVAAGDLIGASPLLSARVPRRADDRGHERAGPRRLRGGQPRVRRGLHRAAAHGRTADASTTATAPTTRTPAPTAPSRARASTTSPPTSSRTGTDQTILPPYAIKNIRTAPRSASSA